MTEQTVGQNIIKPERELTPWQKAARFVIKMDREALEFLADK